MNQKIAFIDDETSILESLKWLFKDEPYQTLTFQSPTKALKKMDEDEFAVVVADQIMPEMEGITFLRKVKERRPVTVRMMMTAQADMNMALNAINQGSIFRLVLKPWDAIEMKTAVKNAIDLYEVKSDIQRLWRITRSQNELLQELNQQLIKKVDEQSIEIKEIEKERRAFEAQLIQSQKMEALGTLAEGIVHDFNNILSGIMGHTEIASIMVDENPQVKGILNKALSGCKRAKGLTNQILSFSRPCEEEPRPIHISPIIKEAIKLIVASLPPNIKILQNIENNKGVVEADPTRIHQILMNLCTNSAHAMGAKGGVLEVSLVSEDLDADEVATYHYLKPGSHLKLSVRDTGHGMDQSTMKRIFNPYFTTKEKGEGTGLGLAVVRGIVNNYQGAITVESEPEKGTTFHVYLPRLDLPL